MLVYDRDGAGLPTYVPRRRGLRLVAPAYDRARSFIGSLGASTTFDRFLAVLAAHSAFTDRDRDTAASSWAIGFYEGARAAMRLSGRELPPFEEAYRAPVDDGVIAFVEPPASPTDPRSRRSKACRAAFEEDS